MKVDDLQLPSFCNHPMSTFCNKESQRHFLQMTKAIDFSALQCWWVVGMMTLKEKPQDHHLHSLDCKRVSPTTAASNDKCP